MDLQLWKNLTRFPSPTPVVLAVVGAVVAFWASPCLSVSMRRTTRKGTRHSLGHIDASILAWTSLRKDPKSQIATFRERLKLQVWGNWQDDTKTSNPFREQLAKEPTRSLNCFWIANHTSSLTFSAQPEQIDKQQKRKLERNLAPQTPNQATTTKTTRGWSCLLRVEKRWRKPSKSHHDQTFNMHGMTHAAPW